MNQTKMREKIMKILKWLSQILTLVTMLKKMVEKLLK